ncbi:MAG TPA: hypothetical protein VEY06_04395, partial [Flavisolibacter sp.]|nr:hypothetical protein [Flavisolibacter sp.]
SAPQKEPQKETPKALQDKSFAEGYSRGEGGDVVESLYGELVTKAPELKNLETEIRVLKQSRDDSTRLFDSYNQRNQSYFNAALLDIRHINDSLLRERIKRLISGNREAYDSTILKHTLLLNVIKERTATLNDLHIALKITRTLPLIEKFQKDNKPSTGPLKGFANNLDKAIKVADTLIIN